MKKALCLIILLSLLTGCACVAEKGKDWNMSILKTIGNHNPINVHSLERTRGRCPQTAASTFL